MQGSPSEVVQVFDDTVLAERTYVRRVEEKVAVRFETMKCTVTAAGVLMTLSAERIDQLGHTELSLADDKLEGRRAEILGPLHEQLLALDCVATEAGWQKLS